MRYRPEVDGLRALAVVPVILFHAGLPGFAGGFVGVDVFFVISGYLITTILVQDLEQGRFSLVQFYERRARRILPALGFVLLLCLPAAWAWLLPNDLRDFSRSIVAVMVFASNILFWRESGYFATAAELKPLLHTWSLAVEEQYYLFFPIFLAAVWRLGRARVAVLLGAIAAVSFALAEWQVRRSPAAAFFLLPTRGWELLVGALLALRQEPEADVADGASTASVLAQAMAVLGLAGVVWSAMTYDASTPFPGARALLPTLGTALVIAFGTPATVVGRVLGKRPLVGIGLVSYSAYLWHQPMLAFARHATGGAPERPLLAGLALLSLGLAWPTWRWVERPFRDRARLSRTRIFRVASVTLAGFVVIGLAGTFTGGFERRLPAEVRAVLRVRGEHQRAQRFGSCLVMGNRTDIGGCARGDSMSGTRVALIGDSHAAALAATLDRAMATRQVRLEQVAKSGCAPVEGMVNAIEDSCAKFVDALLAAQERTPADAYVVAARWSFPVTLPHDGVGRGAASDGGPRYSVRGVPLSAPFDERRDAMLRAYAATLARLAAIGRPVVLVYPIPEPHRDVPILLARRMLGAKGAAATWEIPAAEARAEHALITALFDSLPLPPNVRRVRPDAVLCGTARATSCTLARGSVPLYFDDHHLSDAGATPVVERIVTALEEVGIVPPSVTAQR